MPASRCVLGILILLGIYLSGCDKPQGSSTAQANAGSSAATQPAVAVPPRGPVSLVSVPVLVILPADWSLDPPGSPNFLKGPAPDGNVRISLSMLESMDGNRRDRFLVAAADLAQKHPQRIQIRQLTSVRG